MLLSCDRVVVNKSGNSIVENVLNDTEKSVMATFEFLNEQFSPAAEDNRLVIL